MADILEFRILKDGDLPQMYRAFRSAFSDYPIPFQLSEEHFRKKFVDKLNINYSLSAGAFSNRWMCGFIFTSISNYRGILTAYNGGTGVIPSFRGLGISSRLYDMLIPSFQKNGVKQCILEVLIKNAPAIRVYEKFGFRISRNFKCYRLLKPVSLPEKDPDHSRIRRVQAPDWDVYIKFFEYWPCYLDNLTMIEKNIENEVVIEAEVRDRVAGYAIFQPSIGRISHIAVDKEFRRKGIGSKLLHYIYNHSKNRSLTIINVLEEAGSIHHFLKHAGFENELEQHEMRLIF